MAISTRLMLVIICIVFTNVFSLEKKITVLTSGETHAMLSACDCPTEPGGGFAKRATIVSNLRDSGDVILLDAGGFAGGGLYDSYTEGRHNDSLRTLATMRAMGYIKYDAVCIGDDDLQYGTLWLAKQAFYNKVPLVSANCFYKSNKPVVAPYVIIKKGNHSFGITGVTTDEPLVSVDDSVTLKPVVSSLKKIWKELCSKSDFQIILAHVGELESKALLDSFPQCKIVVNGHRKTSMNEYVNDRGQVMLQFGFQGKSLAFADLQATDSSLSIQKTGWYTVGANIPENPDVAKLVALPSVSIGNAAKPVFDLYIMSHCPYGSAALKEFVSFVELFPSIEWQVWFVGSTSIDGSVSSLHGKSEVNDELLWLAIKAIYPNSWLQFLKKRAATTTTESESIIRDMGLDLSKLRQWVTLKGMDELKKQYTRSMRMGINASPTLLVNNGAFKNDVSTFSLSKTVCGMTGNKLSFCDSLPECASNTDCKKPGKVGLCITKQGKMATCVYKDALRFSVTVIVPDSSFTHPEGEILYSIIDGFPGVAIDTVKASSLRGKTLLTEYTIPFLPYFLFDKTIEKDPNYASLEPALIVHKDKMVFKSGMIKPTFFYKRENTKNSIELYADPLFAGSKDAIRLVLQSVKNKAVVKIMPLLYSAPSNASASAEDVLREEESLRWLVIMKRYPDRFGEYLTLFLERKNMSYWFTDCKKIGIDVDAFVKDIELEMPLLSLYWQEHEMLGMKEPVEMLLGNREVVAVKNPKELGEILNRVK